MRRAIKKCVLRRTLKLLSLKPFIDVSHLRLISPNFFAKQKTAGAQQKEIAIQFYQPFGAKHICVRTAQNLVLKLPFSLTNRIVHNFTNSQVLKLRPTFILCTFYATFQQDQCQSICRRQLRKLRISGNARSFPEMTRVSSIV